MEALSYDAKMTNGVRVVLAKHHQGGDVNVPGDYNARRSRVGLGMTAEKKSSVSLDPSPQSPSRRMAVGALLSASAGLVPAKGAPARESRRAMIDASVFGVLADGKTDDAPALAKAVAALADHSVLNLPPGIVALGSAGWPGILIRRMTRVRIQGHSTTLKWLAQPSQSTSGFGPTGLRLLECQDAVVADLAIDGNGINCIGLGLDTCTTCVVQGIDAYAHGIATPPSGGGQFASSKGNHNSWIGCVAHDSTPGSRTRGFYLGNANSGWGDTDLRIEACVARNNTATGFAIEAAGVICVDCVAENNGGAGFTSSTANGSPSIDHVFRGNIARQNSFHGWQTDVYGPNAERIILSGNIFSGNTHAGVYCHKGTNISVVGNILSDNGRDTASAAVSISMSNRVTVANNVIEGDAKHGGCIAFSYPGNRVSHVIIANNTCRGSNSDTISIEAADGASLSQILVSGNVVTGGDRGIHLGTSTATAKLDSITVVNNLADQAAAANYLFADHGGARSANVRDQGNSWNSLSGESVSVPMDGNWQRGAILFNSSPARGSPIGWVCTASGAPGTWNPFGTIGP